MRVGERSRIGRVAVALTAGLVLASCAGGEDGTRDSSTTDGIPATTAPTTPPPTAAPATTPPATTPPASVPPTTGSPPPTAEAVPALASVGCGTTSGVAPGDELITMTSGGVQREYRRHVPAAHDGTSPVPVVVDFHGYSEGAAIHVEMSALGRFGDEEGFVTITPQGLGAVAMWDTTLGSADLAFVGDLLDDVESTLCVDRSRIFVTGLSNGAFMSSAVACAYADRVAAVAPVAGVRTIDGCAPERPVPVVAFHGTEDGYVAFDGGLGERAANLPAPDGSGRTLGEVGLEELGPDDATAAPSIPEIVADWALRNGCDTPASETPVADDVVRVSYSCPQGADVELYRIEGGGHSWPGSDFSARVESYVGPTTFSIDANEVMWSFFQDHPLAVNAASG